MNVAIYSRKSKFTGAGDSVENQVDICKEHLAHVMRGKEYTLSIYEDEGFSGKNLKRPMFKQMLSDINSGKINVLVCYRLDRVSRNVSDFSQLLELLQSHGVDFISVKESFDTSSPMGRAMISIASVFAQLERETIAERVKDSKIQIAKSGRWQGGKGPLGYKQEQVFYSNDDDDKKRSVYYLMEDTQSDEYKVALTIFKLAKENNSITKIESYLMTNRILTPTGHEYANTVISNILRNPTYVRNDACVYDYLSKHGCTMSNERSEYDGKHGLVGYGKTGGEKRTRNEKSDWIISIGRHSGIISGEEWIAIQEKMQQNKLKYPRLQTSEVALFSGMIKCTCGAPMLVKGNRNDKDGNPNYYYKCYRKDRSYGELCSCGNIKGPTFDVEVIKKLKDLIGENGEMGNDIKICKNKLAKTKTQLQKGIFTLQDQLAKKEREAEQLVLKFTQADLPQNILTVIETTLYKLSGDMDDIKQQLESHNNQLTSIQIDGTNLDLIQDRINNFIEKEHSLSNTERRDILKTIIKSIQWNGTDFHITLFTDVLTQD